MDTGTLALMPPSGTKVGGVFTAPKKGKGCSKQTFKAEMDELDVEIRSYIKDYKFASNLPDAVLQIQAAWRARGPRLFFSRFVSLRDRSLTHTLGFYFSHLAKYTRAPRHLRRRLLQRCMSEWREIIHLKMQLYSKLILKLKASMMIDVADSQSPNHLWMLCTAPGEDPWRSHLNLGRLVSNMIVRQAPQRRTRLYFDLWKDFVRVKAQQRVAAAARLASVEASRMRENIRMAFIFWFRFAIVSVADRLRIEAPLFRPRMAEWDEWLFQHNRSKELRQRSEKLHRGFRMRHCLLFWHQFTVRNAKMRSVWMSVAAQQIEDVMRHSLNALKANWRYNLYRKKVHRNVFKSWLWLTNRNIEVRRISAKVAAITRRSVMLQCLRRLVKWRRMSLMLDISASIQIWQRRTLCLGPISAWVGDRVQMIFVMGFTRWKTWAVGRLRFKCFLRARIQRVREHKVELDIAFRSWRKVALQRREVREMALVAGEEAMAVKLMTRRQRTLQDASYSSSRKFDWVGSTGLTMKRGDQSFRRLSLDGASTEASSSILTPRFDDQTMRAQDEVAGEEREVSVTGEARPGPRAIPSIPEAEDEVTTVDAFVAEALRVFDEEGGEVALTAADFPFGSPWRPYISRSQIMRSNDAATLGVITEDKINTLVQGLWDLEGNFWPGSRQGSGLYFDLFERAEVDTLHMSWIDRTNIGALQDWRLSSPDPTMWQHLVGLRASSFSPNPDHCGHLYESNTLPLVEDVASIKLSAFQSYMKPNWGMGEEASNYGYVQLIEQEEKERDEAMRLELTMAVLARRGEVKEVPALGPIALMEQRKRQRWVERDIRAIERGVRMTEENRWLIFMYRLGEAEQLLETCACALLGIGFNSLAVLYHLLRERCQQPGALHGDMLVNLLEAAHMHDSTFMSANLTYRRNRDRVITMGMELHEKAYNLHQHRPEFTLTFPDLPPHLMATKATAKDKEMYDYDSDSGSDDSPTSALLFVAYHPPAAGGKNESNPEQRHGASSPSPTGYMKSKTLSKSPTLSKSQALKMEMLSSRSMRRRGQGKTEEEDHVAGGSGNHRGLTPSPVLTSVPSSKWMPGGGGGHKGKPHSFTTSKSMLRKTGHGSHSTSHVAEKVVEPEVPPSPLTPWNPSRPLEGDGDPVASSSPQSRGLTPPSAPLRPSDDKGYGSETGVLLTYYRYLGGPQRLFSDLCGISGSRGADMIAIKPPPFMHDLDRAADRILDVKLPSLFALPLLPAVVFSSWGVDWSKQKEEALVPEANADPTKVEEDSEDEGSPMITSDHASPLFVSISASLAFSKMDYASLVSNSVRLSQFRILLQSLLSTESSLPLSSVTVNTISRGSVIVSVTFDFPSNAYSYPEAKAVVQGIMARAGEIFSSSLKDFRVEPPEISLLTANDPLGQDIKDGPSENIREEDGEVGDEELLPQGSRMGARKSEDGVGGLGARDPKVPKLALPASNAAHQGQDTFASHHSDAIGNALTDMAAGLMAKGHESIGGDLDDSTLTAAAMALSFFEERRTKSVRRMEQDVVDSILILRGEKPEHEAEAEAEEDENERLRREGAPSPFDDWLQEATPRSGLPTDVAAATHEEEGHDASLQISRASSKSSKFTPSSQQVDIFLGGYMRGRQKERAIAAKERGESADGIASLHPNPRIPSRLGRNQGGQDEEEDESFRLDPPLRAEGSSYNAASLIASSSYAHGVGLLLDDRFDLMHELSLPDLSRLGGKKPKLSAFARNEMELLEVELSAGKKKKDKRGHGSIGGSSHPHSPLDRSPSNSRRGSLNGASKLPSFGKGVETSDPSLTLPSHLRQGGKKKGRQAPSNLSETTQDDYSTSVAAAAQASASTRARNAPAAVGRGGRGLEKGSLHRKLSGLGSKPSSSSLYSPPVPPRRSPQSLEPHDPSEEFPARPGTVDSSGYPDSEEESIAMPFIQDELQYLNPLGTLDSIHESFPLSSHPPPGTTYPNPRISTLPFTREDLSPWSEDPPILPGSHPGPHLTQLAGGSSKDSPRGGQGVTIGPGSNPPNPLLQGLGSPRSGSSFPVGPPIYSPLPRPPLPLPSHPRVPSHDDQRADSPTLTFPLGSLASRESPTTPLLTSAASSDQGGGSLGPSRLGTRAEAYTPPSLHLAPASKGSGTIPPLNLTPLDPASQPTDLFSLPLVTPEDTRGHQEGKSPDPPLEAPEEIPMFVSSTGKRWQQQLKQRALANLDPLPASAFITGVDITSGGGGGGSSSSPTPRLTLIDNAPSLLDEETRAEQEALRSMWCSEPYSTNHRGEDQGALLISQVISSAEEESWREYERGADRFAAELVVALSRQDKARQAQSLKPRSHVQGQEEGGSQAASHLPSPSRQMMETLSREGERLADTIDPELLTGLSLGGYDEPLYDLMGRLMVAPAVTKLMFFNKVQGLESLAKRMLEDRELARQMNELVWAAGLGMDDLDPDPPFKGRDGGQGGVDKRHSLPPAIRRRAQPPLPQGVSSRGVQRAQAWPDTGNPSPLVTTHRILPPKSLAVKQASPSPSASASPRVKEEDHMIFIGEADKRKITAEMRQEALRGRFDRLMEARRLMAEAVKEASLMTPEESLASYYDVAPTAEEEAHVIDSLADVTVALHQDLLERARAREKTKKRENGGAVFWGAPPSVSLTANGMHYGQISADRGVRIVARNAQEVLDLARTVGGQISVTIKDEQKGIRAIRLPAPLG